jgi:hypothetical protein
MIPVIVIVTIVCLCVAFCVTRAASAVEHVADCDVDVADKDADNALRERAIQRELNGVAETMVEARGLVARIDQVERTQANHDARIAALNASRRQ